MSDQTFDSSINTVLQEAATTFLSSGQASAIINVLDRLVSYSVLYSSITGPDVNKPEKSSAVAATLAPIASVLAKDIAAANETCINLLRTGQQTGHTARWVENGRDALDSGSITIAAELLGKNRARLVSSLGGNGKWLDKCAQFAATIELTAACEQDGMRIMAKGEKGAVFERFVSTIPSSIEPRLGMETACVDYSRALSVSIPNSINRKDGSALIESLWDNARQAQSEFERHVRMLETGRIGLLSGAEPATAAIGALWALILALIALASAGVGLALFIAGGCGSSRPTNPDFCIVAGILFGTALLLGIGSFAVWAGTGNRYAINGVVVNPPVGGSASGGSTPGGAGGYSWP